MSTSSHLRRRGRTARDQPQRPAQWTPVIERTSPPPEMFLPSAERRTISSSSSSSRRRDVVVYSRHRSLSRHRSFSQIPPSTPRYYEHETFQNDPHEFGGIVPFLFRVLRTLCWVTLLFTVSASTYLLFYRWMMPKQITSLSFYIDYHAPEIAPVVEQSMPTIETPEQRIPTLPRLFREGKPFAADRSGNEPYTTEEAPSASSSLQSTLPWSHIDLFARHSQWEASHEALVPAPLTRTRLLRQGQAYVIEIHADLFESHANLDAGIFGLSVELQSSNGTALALSRRSLQLRHVTPWIATVRRVLTLPALLVGALDESRRITTVPFRNFVESGDLPLRFITLRLSSRKVELTRGYIRIGEERSQIQEFLVEWYFTCWFLGTITFAIVYLTMGNVLFAAWMWYDRRQFSLEEPVCDLDLEEDDFDERWHGNDVDPTWDRPDHVSSQPRTEASRQVPEFEATRNMEPAFSQPDRVPFVEDHDVGSDGSWEEILHPPIIQDAL